MSFCLLEWIDPILLHMEKRRCPTVPSSFIVRGGASRWAAAESAKLILIHSTYTQIYPRDRQTDTARAEPLYTAHTHIHTLQLYSAPSCPPSFHLFSVSDSLQLLMMLLCIKKWRRKIMWSTLFSRSLLLILVLCCRSGSLTDNYIW